MMKKLIICLFLTGIVGICSLSAQNLLDNEFQRAGRQYEYQANIALEGGDYEKAAELATLASIEYRKSREYADAQLLMYRAKNAITIAEQEIAAIERTPRLTTHAAELAQANAKLKQAQDLFTAVNWEDSRLRALEALAIARSIPKMDGNVATVTLPKFYVVVRRDSNHDCYWNIAKMPAVYGNGLLWPRLYMANKVRMRDPENPNLIYPGMIVEIPALRGEARDGTYEEGKQYPALPK